MPIYEYECLVCGQIFEKRQRFSDEPKAVCPNGHTETRRLLAAPAIVFKGSGFYVTDNKTNYKATSNNGANGSAKKEKEKTDTKDTKTKAEKATESS